MVPLHIVNNDFAQSTVGFHQDGNGQFLVELNNFSTPGRGVQFYDCGTNENIVGINRINSAHVGANSNKVNTGLRYWGNCFQNNAAIDMNNQNGSIYPIQGEFFGAAAGNCFEDGSGVKISNEGGTGPLIYVILPNIPTSNCKYPDIDYSSYNYIVQTLAQSDPYIDCAGFPFFTSGGAESFCNIPDTASIAELITIRQQILNQMNTLTNLYSPGSLELDYWRYTYHNCLQKLDDIVGRMSFVLESDDPLANKEAAITYFNSHGDFMNKTTAYGIMVTFGEYSRAMAYLDTLTVLNTEESNFKWVQSINLDYLQDIFEYNLTEQDRLQLAQIGRAEGPYTGYARSLYEVLTGERIEVHFAELEEAEPREPGQSESKIEPTISTFPNPVLNGRLYIEVTGLSASSGLQIALFDIHGRLSAQQPTASDGTHSIDVSRLASGMYLLKVSSSGKEVLYQTKVTILN